MKPFISSDRSKEETGSAQGKQQLFLERRHFLLIRFLHLFMIYQINF